MWNMHICTHWDEFFHEYIECAAHNRIDEVEVQSKQYANLSTKPLQYSSLNQSAWRIHSRWGEMQNGKKKSQINYIVVFKLNPPCVKMLEFLLHCVFRPCRLFNFCHQPNYFFAYGRGEGEGSAWKTTNFRLYHSQII